jgi:hypothetical protein
MASRDSALHATCVVTFGHAVGFLRQRIRHQHEQPARSQHKQDEAAVCFRTVCSKAQHTISESVLERLGRARFDSQTHWPFTSVKFELAQWPHSGLLQRRTGERYKRISSGVRPRERQAVLGATRGRFTAIGRARENGGRASISSVRNPACPAPNKRNT